MRNIYGYGLRRVGHAVMRRLVPASAVPAASIEPALLRRVLICRLNHRLGNALFLTPLITSLHRNLPDCEIDLLLGEAQAAELLSHLPGVGRVYSIPRISRHPTALWHLLRALRQRDYDLALDPVSESFGNRLALLAVGARESLGFHRPDQWVPLTHAATPTVKRTHAALRPLALLQHLLPQAPLVERLTLTLPCAPMRSLDDAQPRCGAGPTIGFFCEATGAKALPRDWWLHFITCLQALHPQLHLVQVLPPSGGESLRAEVATVRHARLTQLAGHIRQMDAFISADTGPMHLAAAVHTPTIGLFTVTSPAKFGPLGPADLALRIDPADLDTPIGAARQVSDHLSGLLETQPPPLRQLRQLRRA